MTISAPSKKQNVLISAGVWLLLGFMVLLFQPLTWGFRLPYVFLIRQLAVFLMIICLYYVTTRVVVQKTLFLNKVWPFILWVIVATALASGCAELLNNKLQVSEAMSRVVGDHRPPRRHGKLDIFTMISTLLALGIGTSVAAFSRWQADALLRKELEKEKVRSELAFLKAQINPHFFFNTLNNIYSLSFIDVPASQDALHKLSRMMRYLLYETGNDTTSLNKELSFVRDYIALMKLRMQDSSAIIFNEPAVADDVQIAPMLILPYVENAFKHGIGASGNDRITVDISYNKHLLEVKVENTIHRSAGAAQFQEHSGIGLQNTLRRLDLLYPDRFILKTEQDPEANTYRIYLKLNLS